MSEEEAWPPEHLAGVKGMDLVRRVLEEARGAAKQQGKDIGRGGRSPEQRRRVAGGRRTWSGPGPDARDPQLLGRAAGDLAKRRGWSSRVSEGAVFGRWEAVVGEQIAAHATPTALNEGAYGGRGVHGVGDTAPIGAGTAAGEDRRGHR